MHIKVTCIAPTLQPKIPLPCHKGLVRINLCFCFPEVGLYPMDDPNIHARVFAKFPTQAPTHIYLVTQRYNFPFLTPIYVNNNNCSCQHGTTDPM